jgi:hypothetical protein
LNLLKGIKCGKLCSIKKPLKCNARCPLGKAEGGIFSGGEPGVALLPIRYGAPRDELTILRDTNETSHSTGKCPNLKLAAIPGPRFFGRKIQKMHFIPKV